MKIALIWHSVLDTQSDLTWGSAKHCPSKIHLLLLMFLKIIISVETPNQRWLHAETSLASCPGTLLQVIFFATKQAGVWIHTWVCVHKWVQNPGSFPDFIFWSLLNLLSNGIFILKLFLRYLEGNLHPQVI